MWMRLLPSPNISTAPFGRSFQSGVRWYMDFGFMAFARNSSVTLNTVPGISPLAEMSLLWGTRYSPM